MDSFVGEIGAFDDAPGVIEALMRRARPLGMDCVAIGEIPGENVRRLKPFFLNTWPQTWLEVYAGEALGSDDPIVVTARAARMPFTWSDIRADLEAWNLTRGDLRGFDLALAHGWTDGLAVPIHGPGGYAGLVSFAGRPERLGPAERTRLHMLAIYAHDRLLALHEAGPGGRGDPAGHGLTPREAEVIRLLAAGLTDRSIAERLGISERTALHHVTQARDKLGCASRAHLVAEAAALGLIPSLPHR
jgi:LuxR family quorum sensing-dependent transcriptional regulator